MPNRVAMDVRVAFNEVLLNRAKVKVREQSVGVLQRGAQDAGGTTRTPALSDS